MSLDWFSSRKASPIEIERVSRQLPVASAPPEGKRLKCICDAPSPNAVRDWLHWSLWQDKQTDQVWVNCTGGVAGVNVWYGPGVGGPDITGLGER